MSPAHSSIGTRRGRARFAWSLVVLLGAGGCRIGYDLYGTSSASAGVHVPEGGEAGATESGGDADVDATGLGGSSIAPDAGTDADAEAGEPFDGSGDAGADEEAPVRIPIGCKAGALGIIPFTGSLPVLTPGVWKNISPASVPFGADPHALISANAMAMDPCNPATLYVTVGGYNDQSWAFITGGLFKSTDGGSSWAQMGSFTQPGNVRVDPTDPQHLYLGDTVWGSTPGFYVSKDGGKTWAIPQGFLDFAAASLGGNKDVLGIEPDPTDFKHVLVTSSYGWDGCTGGCNAGIAETFDGGDTWTYHKPLAEWAGSGEWSVQFLFSPELGLGDTKTWLFGTKYKGYYRTTDSGTTWAKVAGASPVGAGQIYYTATGVLYASGNQFLQRSTDNGATFANACGMGGYQAVIGDGDLLYSGFTGRTGNLMLVSPEDDGLIWEAQSSQQLIDGPHKLVLDPNSGILYAAMGLGGVFAFQISETWPRVTRPADNPATTSAGLAYAYYEGTWAALPDFGALTPVASGTNANFDMTPAVRTDNFGLRFTGYIDIPTDGTYTFFTRSDDGSKLFIGNTLVVENDLTHTAQEHLGRIRLQAGKHAIRVEYFDTTLFPFVEVRYAGPSVAKQLVPDAVLFH
jgi:hypothetical protein